MKTRIVNHDDHHRLAYPADWRQKMKHAVLITTCLVILAAVGTVVEAADVQVITNVSNNIDEVSKKDIGRIFLRQRSRWGNGVTAKPIDQKDGSDVRRAFNAQVLGRSDKQVTSYWNSQVFAGKNTPPPTAKTDQEVLDYVRSTPGAVGYISAETATSGVKVLRISN